jgi:hypothetical protein
MIRADYLRDNQGNCRSRARHGQQSSRTPMPYMGARNDAACEGVEAAIIGLSHPWALPIAVDKTCRTERLECALDRGKIFYAGVDLRSFYTTKTTSSALVWATSRHQRHVQRIRHQLPWYHSDAAACARDRRLHGRCASDCRSLLFVNRLPPRCDARPLALCIPQPLSAQLSLWPPVIWQSRSARFAGHVRARRGRHLPPGQGWRGTSCDAGVPSPSQ